MTSRLLTVGQVTRLTALSATTIRRYCDTGALESVRLPGGHRRVPAAALEEFLRRHTQPSKLRGGGFAT